MNFIYNRGLSWVACTSVSEIGIAAVFAFHVHYLPSRTEADKTSVALSSIYRGYLQSRGDG